MEGKGRSSLRVTILTHIFWPEGADYKNRQLAAALAQRGHDVTVIAPFPNYPLGRVFDGYHQSWRQWESVDGFRILRLPLYANQSASGFKRFLNYMSFTLMVATTGLMLSGRSDVVFVYSPPMTLGCAAALFRLFRRSRVLLDVVDLWPEAIAGSGMTSSRWVLKISEHIAKRAYRLADRITVLTEGYRQNLLRRGVPAAKMELIPPFADHHLYSRRERDAEFGRQHALAGKFCVLYAGNVGRFQDMDSVVAAARLLRGMESIRLVLVGDGVELQRLRHQVAAQAIANVIVTGSYPVERIPGILAWGDVLLLPLSRDPYMAINLPSKACGYLAAGRPILVCAEGEVSRILDASEGGLCCEPGNPDALASTIRVLYELPQSDRDAMGLRNRDLYEERYSDKVVVQRYVDAIESMCAGRRGHQEKRH